MPISLKELKKIYQGKNETFVEITSREQALAQINSKCSCCWDAGSPFEKTGWVKLASPSAQHKGEKRTVFVCKESLLSETN